MPKLKGVGLGLRRELLAPLLQSGQQSGHGIDFIEVAPENWLPFGGSLRRQFTEIASHYPLICHGLSLSIAGPDPLDLQFLAQLKQFFRQHQVLLYSEHLSYCSGQGHLYDLMPVPFCPQAIDYLVPRIRQVQDVLEQELVLENISYYATPESTMTELEFLTEVLERADCGLLLDVNNIYVNSINHGYDATAFLRALPTKRIRYGHVAGHLQQSSDLLIDTHGSAVNDPVWALLAEAYRCHGVFPTLLERDFNLPPLAELLTELTQIRQLQQENAMTLGAC
jgi:hypothetical protein